MQLVSRKILFDIQRRKHKVQLSETDKAMPAFKTFCRKATDTYDSIHGQPKYITMELFANKMLQFMNDNIKQIRYVGQGSSRIVFAMADGTALKMAKTEAGQAQNKREVEVCLDPIMKYKCFPEFYDADRKDWLALNCELCAPATKEDFADLLDAMPTSLTNLIEFVVKSGIEDWEFKKLISYFENIGNISSQHCAVKLANEKSPATNAIMELIRFYRENGLESLLLADLDRVENWGIAFRDDKKVLLVIDAGFNEDVLNRFY